MGVLAAWWWLVVPRCVASPVVAVLVSALAGLGPPTREAIAGRGRAAAPPPPACAGCAGEQKIKEKKWNTSGRKN
ncbi:MAG TPA: hypothetical protein VK211_29270 [Kamptonema sp.]|nr:hypothetical protein [Kamptonema sp.]